KPDITSLIGDFETSHCAYEHHAFDAQILDARTFGEGLADGGDEQNSAGGNTGAENFDPVHWAVSCAGRTHLISYLRRTSLLMIRKRVMPWIRKEMPEGWISRLATSS